MQTDQQPGRFLDQTALTAHRFGWLNFESVFPALMSCLFPAGE